MYADIEALVLSGELFNGKERSSSPTRSDSSNDSGWHDDELELSSEAQKYKDMGYDTDTACKRAHNDHRDASAQQGSIGMGPGRTGVKGVIRDREEAIDIEREKRAREMEDLRKRMEAGSLGGKTYLDEERQRAARGEDHIDDLVLKELERGAAKRDVFGVKRSRFGYLREVGVKQFVRAVEQEEKGVWIVVHIYDPSLDRCYLLDDLLAHLAKEHPTTKFLRARATALEFALLDRSKSKSKPRPLQRQRRTYKDDDDDEFFGDGNEDDEVEEAESRLDDEDIDLEMLPTLLVYRDGELVHNWVRVDWVAGEAGVDELLRNRNIISRGVFSQGDSYLDDNSLDSDDGEFQASLDRILKRSEEHDLVEL